jgi:predicted phage-related endonuclease
MIVYGDEWRRVQSLTIGGSSAAAVIGKSRFKTPQLLWDQLRAATVENRVPPRLQESNDMRRGNILEPIALDQLGKYLSRAVTPHDQCDFLYNPALPWAHALPDGWMGEELVEVKVPRPATIVKCVTGALIEEWYYQAQHNMAVARATCPQCDKCHVGLLDPMTCLIHDFVVNFNEVVACELMDAERTFMESVRAGNRPEGEAAEKLSTAEDAGESVILDTPEVKALASSYIELNEIKKEADDSIKTVKARLKKELGTSPVTVVPGVARIHNKRCKDSVGFDKHALFEAYPEFKTDKRFVKKVPGSPYFMVVPLEPLT